MPPILHGIRNIIFDLGGVLFEIDYSAPAHAFSKLGIKNFDRQLSKSSQEGIFDLLETGKISNENFLQYLLDKCPGATLQEVTDAWNSILKGLWEERIEFVRHLRTSGYRTFLLSNTNAIHSEAFGKMIDQQIGLPNFHSVFEKIYYSHQIGRRKPDPALFQQVCKWNDLDPRETLFIDDSVQHIQGAAKAGLKSVHLDTPTRFEDIFF